MIKQNIKIKDNISAEGRRMLHARLDEFFEAEDGFVIIFDGKKQKATDYYQGICSHCITNIVKDCVTHFYEFFGINFDCDHKCDAK